VGGPPGCRGWRGPYAILLSALGISLGSWKVAEKCGENSVRFVFGPAARVNMPAGGADAKFGACADHPIGKLAVELKT